MKAVLLIVIPLGMAMGSPALDLVRNGQPVGTFVLPPEAPFTAAYAVRDVRHWIGEMTGATVPIVDTAPVDKGTRVFVDTNGKTIGDVDFGHQWESPLPLTVPENTTRVRFMVWSYLLEEIRITRRPLE